MDGIWNPLENYRTELAVRHRENTLQFFEELVKRSGVDESANIEQVKGIRLLEKRVSSLAGRVRWLNVLRIVCVFLAIAGCVLPFLKDQINYGDNFNAVIGGCIAAVILSLGAILAWLNPRIKALKGELAHQEEELTAAIAVAEQQMRPLNDLFSWGMVIRIIEKTLPAFHFDEFCTFRRCDDLEQNYGMNLDLGEETSIVNCQSGCFHKNPFILAETLNMTMGEETYTGSIYITWQERESYTDEKGNRRTRWVTKSETLVASVTKPKPVYTQDRFLLYGHEAAPTLNFSRNPTGLDGDDKDWWSKFKVSRKISQLESKGRKLEGFTMMANRKFEAVFQATDRSDDIQFRLLFTPLAQKDMLELVSEDGVSLGDDFSFYKRGMLNIIRSSRLSEIDFVAAPSRFRSYELADARKKFNDFSNEYFRIFYFTFAPLLTIPLYQEERSLAVTSAAETICGVEAASAWEFESLANYYGEHHFKPPSSVTRNILKVHSDDHGKDGASISVTAHGFYTVEHVEHISKYGGDGKWHDVPVHWLEYVPVSRVTQMAVQETAGDNSHDASSDSASARFMKNVHGEGASVLMRRAILSILKG